MGNAFDRIRRERIGYLGDLDIGIMAKKQFPDIALGVDKGGAEDQGIMYGYVTDETPELLPALSLWRRIFYRF